MMKSKLYSLFTALFLFLLITLPRIDASAAGGKWNLRDGNWYYTEADGTDHTGWLLDGSTWYYMDEEGVMQTGWLQLGSNRFYMRPDGGMRTGWFKVDGAWYYADGNGYIKTGWLHIGQNWFYMNSEGAMRTGWINYNGTWYYFDNNGYMKTGWIRDGGIWYYLNGDGAMQTGWKTLGGRRYYLSASGAMVTGFQVIGDRVYAFGSSGALESDWASRNVIVLDPGHSSQVPDWDVPIGPGSSDMKEADNLGAVGLWTGVHEYELNLDVSLMLRERLEARGYHVIMVRTTNTGIYSCVDRARVANNTDAAIFVRIHANAAPKNHSQNGALTICITEDNEFVPEMYSASRLLSDVILNSYVRSTGCYNEGVMERDDMIANNWSEVPTTLIELGYLTNETEDNLMQTSEYRKKMVDGLVNGIDEYFRRTVH